MEKYSKTHVVNTSKGRQKQYFLYQFKGTYYQDKFMYVLCVYMRGQNEEYLLIQEYVLNQVLTIRVGLLYVHEVYTGTE